MQDWIRESLSEEQCAPFDRDTRNACILAAAGSGKTRTLVHLVAEDLAKGVPATSIIAFTFTEKSAEELLTRIHFLAKTNLPGVSLEGMYIGTIHAWCLKFLMNQSDFYGFTGIDELHLDALISRLYDEIGLADTYGQPYPRGIRNFKADLEIYYNEHLADADIPDGIKNSITKFIGILKANRLLSFGGMVRNATEHLKTNGPVEGLRALYVDEYQDVNPAQVELVKAMLPDRGSVVTVGDDLQCIYNWRGSDVARILRFADEFDDPSIHRLSTNYRARPTIVTFGNAISDDIQLRDKDKVMVPGRDSIPFPAVHWLSVNSESEQVDSVVRIVKKFQGSGVPLNKIAILLRSVLNSGPAFVDALARNDVNVNCPILSRGVAFINELLLPVFGFLSEVRAEPRNELEQEEQEYKFHQFQTSICKWVPKENLETFLDGIHAWADILDSGRNEGYDVRGRFFDLLDRCGLGVGADDANLSVGLGIASQIIRSVEEIHRRRLTGFKRRTSRGVMREVYYALGRFQSSFGESVPIQDLSDGVWLSTVHQAKGLEWPIVVLPMMMNRLFPVRSRPHGTSYPDELVSRYGTSTEDERRLFYVAATRAKERLFLVDGAGIDDRSRSSFLNDLRDKKVAKPIQLDEINDDVWTVHPDDLESDPPPPVRIGLSDLLIYLECPYQFALRRIAAIQPSVGDELGFGKGLHEVIQRRFDEPDGWTDEQLEEQVNTYVNLPYTSEKSEAESRKAIHKRVKSLDELGIFDARSESEVSVEVLLDDGIIHGIIDGIQVKDDGSVVVRDWKSNLHQEFASRYERQLQFYTYALRSQGRIVSGAGIVDVAASSKAGQIVSRDVDITDDAINALVEQVRKALRDIAAKEFVATPGMDACGCCDMVRVCSERFTE